MYFLFSFKLKFWLRLWLLSLFNLWDTPYFYLAYCELSIYLVSKHVDFTFFRDLVSRKISPRIAVSFTIEWFCNHTEVTVAITSAKIRSAVLTVQYLNVVSFTREMALLCQVKQYCISISFIAIWRRWFPVGFGKAANDISIFNFVQWDARSYFIASIVEILGSPSVNRTSIAHSCD